MDGAAVSIEFQSRSTFSHYPDTGRYTVRDVRVFPRVVTLR